MKISLCIPTMNRWDFLKENLPKYLENPYIDEIVICDENGNDVKEINNTFTSEKIRTFVNDTVLGAFYNKEKVVSFAKNEIVCLMDSDNFAPLSYFEAFIEYTKAHGFHPNTVYIPARTIPQADHGGFDFRNFLGNTINRQNASTVFKLNETLFNVGNYIFSKELFEKAKIPKHMEKLGNICYALDVLLQNYLFFKICPETEFVLVPNMEYHHIVHEGSYYLTTHQNIETNIFNTLFCNL